MGKRRHERIIRHSPPLCIFTGKVYIGIHASLVYRHKVGGKWVEARESLFDILEDEEGERLYKETEWKIL